ncbi:hypothetical protein ABFS82_07G071200 [Erythranthe guttata]
MELKIVFLVVLVLVFASTEKVKSRDAPRPSPVLGEDYQDPWYQYCETIECETSTICQMCSGQCVNSRCKAPA